MDVKATCLKYLQKYRSMIRYIFFGVLTTAVNFGVYTVFTRLIPLDENIANVIAWALSVLFAFITNKSWVFESETTGLKEWLVQLRDFVGARLLSGAFDIGFVWVGLSVLGFNQGYQDFIVKALSNVFVLIMNYVFSKFFVFRKK